jgi:hypothetical protein
MSSIHHWNKNDYKPWISATLNKEFLMKKNRKELEKIGRKHGIELDRRKLKSTLVDELYKVL